MMRLDVEKLKDFLIDTGTLSLPAFKKLQEEAQNDPIALEELIVRQGIVTPQNFLQIKGHISGIPFIGLERMIIDPETLNLIPEKTAKSLNVIAFRKQDKTLEIAMLDPENLQTIDFIKKKTGLDILPRLTNKESLASVFKQYGASLQEEFSQIVTKASDEAKIGPLKIITEIKEGEEKDLSPKRLQAIAERLPIIQVVDSLLKHAIIQGSSDIHIEPAEQAVIVRYRVDGILRDVMTLPRQVYPAMIARIKVLSNLKLDEHRLPQDGRFKIEEKNQKVSIRVSIIPVMDGEKIVMRLLREDVQGLTLESLGLTGIALERANQAMKRPNGMILVTGPTGSGKTTTLYAAMDILNLPEVNIATVEDPIEYRMQRVNQTQVMPQIGLTFAAGLRSLVRQDPDIIMVGEIRDKETASLAINAALTGHLVLSTLHTNSAAGALPRLLDMNVEPFLVASTVNVIIAQRLVRKLCPDSREQYTLETNQVKTLEKQYDMNRILEILKKNQTIKSDATWTKIPFYRPKTSRGCPDGYKGRMGIFEVLPLTEPIKKLITAQSTSDELQAHAVTEGMITMLGDGFAKAAEGLTSIEEILRVTSD